jgi:hypothetical protein
MKPTLDLIEAQLQSLIENSAQIIPWGNQRFSLTRLFIEAMQNGLRNNENGMITAPNLYTIFLHPQILDLWQRNETIFHSLSDLLQEAASKSGFDFEHPPLIRLAEDNSLGVDDIKISAEDYFDEVGETAAIQIDNNPFRQESAIPKNAFLIVDGISVFHLNQPVINIGRRVDNHLVIDDPRVSRNHSQLRAIKNQYILFDLNASGGTFVNNQRISRQLLKAGDVISLAGVPLIYGQDLPPASNDPNEITGRTTAVES